MNNKVFKYRQVMKEIDICLLRPATIFIIILEVIIVVLLVEVYIGHKIPDTLTRQ